MMCFLPLYAGQSLARSETGEGLWKEIADEVHKDADRLFSTLCTVVIILALFPNQVLAVLILLTLAPSSFLREAIKEPLSLCLFGEHG